MRLDDLVGRPAGNGALAENAATPDATTRADEHGAGPRSPNLLAEAQADVLADPSLRAVQDDPATIVDESADGGSTTPGDEIGIDGERLSEDEQRQVDELQARDREVRAHELAHAAAGGALAGAPSYTYQMGPDGKRYAVGGDVQIRTGGGRTPEEQLQHAAQVRAAALAPANPSGQDLAVAAAAAAQAAQARADLRPDGAADAGPVDVDESREPTGFAVEEDGGGVTTPSERNGMVIDRYTEAMSFVRTSPASGFSAVA